MITPDELEAKKCDQQDAENAARELTDVIRKKHEAVRGKLIDGNYYTSGERIKEFRAEANIGPYEYRHLTGMNANTLHDLEHGQKMKIPQRKTLMLLKKLHEIGALATMTCTPTPQYIPKETRCEGYTMWELLANSSFNDTKQRFETTLLPECEFILENDSLVITKYMSPLVTLYPEDNAFNPTQEELAELMGMQQPNISAIMSGKTPQNKRYTRQLAALEILNKHGLLGEYKKRIGE